MVGCSGGTVTGKKVAHKYLKKLEMSRIDRARTDQAVKLGLAEQVGICCIKRRGAEASLASMKASERTITVTVESIVFLAGSIDSPRPFCIIRVCSCLLYLAREDIPPRGSEFHDSGIQERRRST